MTRFYHHFKSSDCIYIWDTEHHFHDRAINGDRDYFIQRHAKNPHMQFGLFQESSATDPNAVKVVGDFEGTYIVCGPPIDLQYLFDVYIDKIKKPVDDTSTWCQLLGVELGNPT